MSRPHTEPSSDRNIPSDPSFEAPCGVHAENPDAA
jgi:hypothetical protein